MFSKWSIQLKYSLVFILALVLIILGLFIGIYTLKTNQLRNHAMASAEQVIAFRTWVANTGVVWVDHLAPDFHDFLGKRVSSDNSLEFFSKNPALATRELSEIVSKNTTHATFRVTSDEYRNPANAPDPFEIGSIQAFKANKTLKFQDTFEGGFYRYSQPLFVEKPCLQCHGDPKDAPAEVISKYGDKRAFGYKVGDVRGLISVKLPDISVSEVLLSFLNPYTIGLIVLAFLLNFLFTHWVIIKRLKNLVLTTERIAQGELDLPLQHNPGSQDEIDNMRHAIDVLRNSVVIAMKRLQKTLS